MKTQTFILATFLLFNTDVFASAKEPLTEDLKKQKNPGISFTENKGQVHDQNYQSRPDVLYGVMTGNMAVHIKKSGVSYQLYRTDSYKEVEDPKTKSNTSTALSGTRKEIDQQTIYRIDLSWINANKNFNQSHDEALPGYNNYYLENCPNGALNVKSYKGITLKNLYNGIDLHYYEKNGELKHDYIVAPYANYKQIQVTVEGADIIMNPDGSLILRTALGKVEEAAPIVYQNGKRLQAKWLITKNILSFEIENYSPKYELIIDPITRVWGTYYGDSGDDKAYATCTDNTGNVYATGLTLSTAFIATSGSHQGTYSGTGDAFLAKFSPSGLRQWSTYYGGALGDRGNSCTADAFGNIYMVGYTASSGGIATMGSHQTLQAGNFDGFLVKFDASGVRQWGTYYGGSAADYLYSCINDASGNIYIAGQSSSSTFTSISTVGSHQPAYGGGNSDGFLAKFNSNGIRQWGTYYGGSIGYDVGSACTVDNSGDVYMTGVTSSSAGVVIATSGSHQNSYGGGQQDAYLVKFDANGIRQWGTYYGDASVDNGASCTTDASGNVYMAGLTYSTGTSGTLIATTGSHQIGFGGGSIDGFLVKFNSSGVRQWGSYYGGAGIDYFNSCAADSYGNLYVAGNTDVNSNTGIATFGSHQTAYGGGNWDAVLVKFNLNGVRQSGTYYGGAGDDYGYFCASDATSGSVYMSGETGSSGGNVIASSGSHQSNFGGSPSDGFLVKFDACETAPGSPSAIIGNTAICSGSGANNYSTSIVTGAISYSWNLPSGWSGTSNSNSIFATPGSSGIFTVLASNACGVSPAQTLSVTVYALPVITASTTSNLLCVGETATLTGNGGTSYTFNPGGSGTEITISPTANSSYTLTGKDANGCVNTAIFTQSVDACTSIENEELKIKNSALRIYPNPTNGIINVESETENEIVILNTLGQIVYSAILKVGINQIELDGLAKGVYVVRVSGQASRKLIKE